MRRRGYVSPEERFQQAGDVFASAPKKGGFMDVIGFSRRESEQPTPQPSPQRPQQTEEDEVVEIARTTPQWTDTQEKTTTQHTQQKTKLQEELEASNIPNFLSSSDDEPIDEEAYYEDEVRHLTEVLNDPFLLEEEDDTEFTLSTKDLAEDEVDQAFEQATDEEFLELKGHPVFSTRKAIPFVEDPLANEFIEVYRIKKMKEWQEAFFVLPPSLQAGHILAALPGQGKTLFAIWATICATSSYCIHTKNYYKKKGRRYESRNKKIVLWGVPLRMLAKQLGRDFEKWYGFKKDGEIYPGVGEFDLDEDFNPKKYIPPVKIIEGAGANSDIKGRRVVICTYEHLLNLIHRYDDQLIPGFDKSPSIGSMIGLVVIDEIHEITKPDRGGIIDEILLLCDLLKIPVLAMSGTMPYWALWRLTRAYPNLFHSVIKPDQERRFPIYRVFLNPTARIGGEFKKFSIEDYQPVFEPLALNAIESREERQPNRLVVFCGSIDDVEKTFVRMAGIFFEYCKTAPTRFAVGDKTFNLRDIIHRVSTNKDLPGDFSLPFTFSDTSKEDDLYKAALTDNFFFLGKDPISPEAFRVFLEFCVVSGFVVFHHSGVGQSDPQIVAKSRIEEILEKHFSVCVATTTVAVGVNLAEVSHVFLGPSWVWTADQGEQMIGRCGRTAPGYAIVVKSDKLMTPGLSSGYTAKNEFFLSRIIAMCYLKHAIMHRSNLSSFVPIVRGFYHPADALPFPIPGISKSLIKYSIDNSFITTDFEVSGFVPDAIILSRHDVRTIPVTVWMLSESPSALVALCWVILTSYIVPENIVNRVNKITKDQPDQAQLTQIDLGEDTRAVTELVIRYANTHSQSDFSKKGVAPSTVQETLFFLRSFIYAVAIDPRPHAQLFGFTQDVFLNFVKGLLVLSDIHTQQIRTVTQQGPRQALSWQHTFSNLSEIGSLFKEFVEHRHPQSVPNDILLFFPTNLTPEEYWTGFSLTTKKESIVLEEEYADVSFEFDYGE